LCIIWVSSVGADLGHNLVQGVADVGANEEHVRWPAGVNFINISRAASRCTDPESAKRSDDLTVIFALLGSARVKAAI